MRCGGGVGRFSGGMLVDEEEWMRQRVEGKGGRGNDVKRRALHHQWATSHRDDR